MKPTPTPWRIADNDASLIMGPSNIIGKRIAEVNHCNNSWPLDQDDVVITYEEMWANAAFIVRAVNSHEQLVEALKNLVTFTEQLCEDVNISKRYPSLVKAKQALAQAEGSV